MYEPSNLPYMFNLALMFLKKTSYNSQLHPPPKHDGFSLELWPFLNILAMVKQWE